MPGSLLQEAFPSAHYLGLSKPASNLESFSAHLFTSPGILEQIYHSFTPKNFVFFRQYHAVTALRNHISGPMVKISYHRYKTICHCLD
ncbi:hypothetical protein GCM10011326_44770 [Salipiger profundus]|nr:hypothetical protein GCM10011326_44770 [Salipiger profundus]